MFYCPLCGRKLIERPYFALKSGQKVLHCYVCEFTLRTHMSYRELYESLGAEKKLDQLSYHQAA